MTSRPILFTGEMVLAIRNDRKAQTRRLRGLDEINASPGDWEVTGGDGLSAFSFSDKRTTRTMTSAEGMRNTRCPYGAAGDQLWVREGWRPAFDRDLYDCIEYRADGKRLKPQGLSESEGFWFDDICPDGEDAPPAKWRPSIHMPRWASRLTLEVTNVRVERVQEISEEDAVAEGTMSYVAGGHMRRREPAEMSVRAHFAVMWNDINAKRGYSWESNPWVWAITFRRVVADRASGTDGE
jgi:hypothetical protein